MQGDHSELLVQLSSVYSRLRDPEASDTLPPLALRTSVRGPASRALSYAGSDFESLASPSGFGDAGRTTKRSAPSGAATVAITAHARHRGCRCHCAF